jgi:hypothetical protein
VADGKLFAALGAATREDFATILCCHPLAESMFVAPLPRVRLIRSFHVDTLLLTKAKKDTEIGPEFQLPVVGEDARPWELTTLILLFFFLALGGGSTV